jgi:coenzyme PQQ precursor peptide PqqA
LADARPSPLGIDERHRASRRTGRSDASDFGRSDLSWSPDRAVEEVMEMWEEPDFEVIEAGAEVTAYVYRR